MKPRIIITNKLKRKLIKRNILYTFISTRDLSLRELNIARDHNLKRYILKQLKENNKEEFFDKFDYF